VDKREVTFAWGSFGERMYLDRGNDVVIARLSRQRVNADPAVIKLELALFKSNTL